MNNDKYILNQWKKTLISVLPITIIMLLTIVIKPANFKPIIGSLLVAMLLVPLIMLSANNKIQRYLKNKSPDKLVKYYDKVFDRGKRTQDSDVLLCYSKAYTYCYYSKFDKALELLNEIDWNKKVSALQSLEISTRALICYLRDKDYKEGLRLSYIAKELGENSIYLPGAAKSREFYDTYIEVGELLNSNYKEAIIRSLEDKFNKAPITLKVLIAWCLANTYSKIGRGDDSKDMLDFCKRITPYCEVLHRIDK